MPRRLGVASVAGSGEQTWWRIWPLGAGFTYHPFVARLSLAKNRSCKYLKLLVLFALVSGSNPGGPTSSCYTAMDRIGGEAALCPFVE